MSGTTVSIDSDFCNIFGSNGVVPREEAMILSVSFYYDAAVDGVQCSTNHIKYEGLKNRILENNGGAKNFIHVSFAKLFEMNFSNRKIKAEETVEKICTSGILLQLSRTNVTRKFFFCGHSNSQLKSRSCYFYGTDTPEKSIEKLINDFGDFTKIKSIEKYVKRVGLLFSSSIVDNITLRPEETLDIPDIERGGHIFTDGCGLISESYARFIVKKNPKLKPCDMIQEYIPSVFQIRYKGYKGILMVAKDEVIDEIASKYVDYNKGNLWKILNWFGFNGGITSDNTKKKVLFVNSMKKFTSCDDNTFAILDFSKPTFFGALNGETVNLIASNGIPNQIFIDKQIHYFESVRDVNYNDINEVKQFLQMMKRFDLMKKIQNASTVPNWMQAQIQKFKRDELRKSFNSDKIAKIHIKIPKSRLLIGVCDTSGKLMEGECYIRLTTNDMKNAVALQGRVLVTRNPCLFPGDIQSFTARNDIPELDHLQDCIVFNTKGVIPIPSMLSGGDLDGDKFFICWDPDLIRMKSVSPMDYASLAPQNKSMERVTLKNCIEYFTYYETKLGLIMSLYWKWVNANPTLRAKSRECVELSKLYSRCVDGEKIFIPKYLMKPPKTSDSNVSIVDLLKENARKLESQQFQSFLSSPASIDIIDETYTTSISSQACIKSSNFFKPSVSSESDTLKDFDQYQQPENTKWKTCKDKLTIIKITTIITVLSVGIYLIYYSIDFESVKSYISYFFDEYVRPIVVILFLIFCIFCRNNSTKKQKQKYKNNKIIEFIVYWLWPRRRQKYNTGRRRF